MNLLWLVLTILLLGAARATFLASWPASEEHPTSFKTASKSHPNAIESTSEVHRMCNERASNFCDSS